MSQSRKVPSPASLLKELENNPELRQKPAAPAQLDPKLLMLRAWQANRLSRTYVDLLETGQYGPASRFFLSDIYASKDFSQRDHDIVTIYTFLSHILPPISLQLLRDSIELNQMTDALDKALLAVLVDQLGVTTTITPARYARAYQICDNYAERAAQIRGIAKTVKAVGEGARWPLVSAALKLVHKPAVRAGWVELYEFLDRGYKAFKPMKNIGYFVDVIRDRETQILDNLFSDKPDPFRLSS
jgi:hypothetical protein